MFTARGIHPGGRVQSKGTGGTGFIFSTGEDQDAQLSMQIVGSLQIQRWNTCGFPVSNEGNVTAHNVSYTFTVSGAADFSYKDIIGDIPAAWAPGVVVPGCVHGFGGITITVTVQSSDAGEVTETARGLQLGCMTLVFR